MCAACKLIAGTTALLSAGLRVVCAHGAPAHLLLEHRTMRDTASLGAARLLGLATLTWAAAACTSTVRSPSPRSRPDPVVQGDHRVESRRVPAKPEGKMLGIPPGQLPPPGECRVWFP